MKELLIKASDGTKFEGNENELYIAICRDYRTRTDLTKEEKINKIAKRIFDMAIIHGYEVR